MTRDSTLSDRFLAGIRATQVADNTPKSGLSTRWQGTRAIEHVLLAYGLMKEIGDVSHNFETVEGTN